MLKKKVFTKKGKKVTRTTPEPRSGHLFLSSEKDETMYVIGGHTELGPQNDVWSYTPSKQTWRLLDNEEMGPQNPLPRFEYDGCIIGSFIYLFGGFQSDDNNVSILNDLWAFDLENPSWNLVCEESKAPERSGHIVVAIDAGRFIVHGGTCMGARSDLWVHSTVTGHWDEIKSPTEPCARSMHSAVYCAEAQTIAIFGGITQVGDDGDLSPQYLNDLWVMRVGDDADDWQWSMVQYHGIAPSPRDLPVLIAVGSGVMLFGGFGFVEITDDLSESDCVLETLDDAGSSAVTNGVTSADSEMSNVDIISGVSAISLNAESIVLDGLSDEKKQSDGISNLSVIGTKKVLFESNSKINIDATEEGDDGDDDSNIAIDYLSDAWYINISTGSTTEINIRELRIAIEPKEGEVQNTEEETIPRRGCKFLHSKNGSIISFGGYDGELFFGIEEQLDGKALKEIVAGISTGPVSEITSKEN